MVGRALLLAAVALAAVSCGPVRATNPHVRAKGDRMFLMGDFPGAAGLYEAYLADNPDDPERARILVLAGKCRLGAGEPEKAILHFDRALESDPGADVRCEAYFRRGVANRMAGRASTAVSDMRRSAAEAMDVRTRVIPADEFHYEHGMALFHAGEWEKGRAEMAKVSDPGPFAAQARSRKDLKGFTVQLGAFTDASRARREAARFEAQVRAVPGGAETLYVVSAGPFLKLTDARAQAAHYKANGCPDAFVLP